MNSKKEEVKKNMLSMMTLFERFQYINKVKEELFNKSTNQIL
jgi:hypothetical protein